ncbi:MAG: hypothetical protein QOJ63_1861 [Solirubrobacteraceae bacterium]|jgi:hypothetical protein|nr:hypothetical protein [Solirubrobacteraceae bacterium]
MSSELAIFGAGGLSRSVINHTRFLLDRAADDRRPSALVVDLAQRDPYAIAPDGTDEFGTTESPQMALLRSSTIQQVLADIAAERPAPAEFEHITVAEAQKLLRRLPKPGEGSGQDPRVTALGLSAERQLVSNKLSAFSSAAHLAAKPGLPWMLGVFGLAGGLGTGSVDRLPRALREQVETTVPILAVLGAPDAWRALPAHAKPSVQRHMDARAAATLRRVAVEGDALDMIWIVSVGGALAAAASPQSGVAPAIATFVATIVQNPGFYSSRLANWRTLRAGGRSFATFGIAQINALPGAHGARIAHEVAIRALSLVVEPDPARQTRARDEACTTIGDAPVLREALPIAEPKTADIVPMAQPERVDSLLRLGTSDDRNPPELPAGIRNPGVLGRRPHGDDVRALSARMVKQDDEVVAKHIAKNRVQGRESATVTIAEMLRRGFPVVIADDPQILVGLAATIGEIARVAEAARERLSADVRRVNAARHPVASAEDALSEGLEPLGRRVSKRAVTACLRATEDVIEAHRWAAGTAGAIALLGEIAGLANAHERQLHAALTTLKDVRRGEQMLHAAQVQQIQAVQAMPHIHLSFALGGLAQTTYDAAIDQALQGNAPSSEHQLLGFASFKLSGDPAASGGWRLMLSWPSDGDRVASRLDEPDSQETIPTDVLSSLAEHGVGAWSGTRGLCAAVPLCDSLGYTLRERAAAVEAAADERQAEAFVKELMDALGATLLPLARIRPSIDEGAPAADPMVFADSRPPLTKAGQLVQPVLEHELAGFKSEAATGQPDSSPTAGTLTIVQHYHGLRAQDFEFMERATHTYVKGDEQVDTNAMGVAAHRIEKAMYERGLTPEARLLDARVVRLLRDAELLDAASVLVAFERLPIRDAERTMGEPQLAINNASGETLRVLAPVGDPAAAIVALCETTDHLRRQILEQAEATQAEIVRSHRGDRAAGQEAYLRRLKALDFTNTAADIDGRDLQLALSLLTNATARSELAMNPLRMDALALPPNGGSSRAGAHT